MPFGYSINTAKRQVKMLCYGSTAGATVYPHFHVNGLKKILPRPYKHSKPDGDAHKLMQSSWFSGLISDVEEQVFYYFISYYPDLDHTLSIVGLLFDVKELIPSSCRIYDSFLLI